jgi:hypothetical protein
MQLRGEQLKIYLIMKLNDIVSSYEGRSTTYIYSQKEFSIYAGVSRETIRKYQHCIDEHLKAECISKHNFDKDAQLRNLAERATRAEARLARSEALYRALRAQSLSIFESLIKNSFDVSLLISKRKECAEVENLFGCCALCGNFVQVPNPD